MLKFCFCETIIAQYFLFVYDNRQYFLKTNKKVKECFSLSCSCFIAIYMIKYLVSYRTRKRGVAVRVAIIGGGAAGLICAASLAVNKNTDVTVFEKNDRVGKKLLSTGNGRCNMTNINATPMDYFGAAEFVSSAFESFSPKSVVEYFEKIGLFSRSDSEGRVYPLSNQAAGVLDALRFECERLKVKFVCCCEITEVKRRREGFVLNGEYCFDRVVFACGGPAGVREYNSFALLSSLGHSVKKTAPSLVRLMTDDPMTKQLKGIRAVVSMSLYSDENRVATESGELLFSDFSLSGIISMQLSSYVSRLKLSGKKRFRVSVDFVPDVSKKRFFELLSSLAAREKIKSENLLSGFMPRKLGACLLKKVGLSPETEASSLSAAQIEKIAEVCKNCKITVTGVGSLSQAQVTIGGVNTDEFDFETLESKIVRGVYCCGEMLDVDGKCGGYNLQWAFSSGLLCAESIVLGCK